MGWLWITRFTLQELLRRRLFLAILLISGGILGVFTLLLNSAIDHALATNAISGNSIDPRLALVASGIFISVPTIWLVYLLSSVLTILLAVGSISGEVEAGTFSVVVPKPLSRYEIVLGKWLGYALLLSLYTACLFGAFLVIIGWKTGYWSPQVWQALAMLELGQLVLLGMTILGSSMLSTITNGATILMLFIAAFIPSFMQIISPDSGLIEQQVTTLINLLIPTNAIWHGVSFYLVSPSTLDILQGLSLKAFDTPITAAQAIPWTLCIWSIFYSILLPLMAAIRFRYRDL